MAEIYVPISYSNVKDIIPVEEDIIYSTSCKAIQNESGALKFWKTHLLMTEKGVAFSKPKKKKKEPPELIYVDWTRVLYVVKKGLRVDISKSYPTSIYGYELVDLNIKSNSTFESRGKFEKRLKEFPKKFYPYVLEKKKSFLQSQDSSFLYGKQRELQERAIRNMEKYYRKKQKIFENL